MAISLVKETLVAITRLPRFARNDGFKETGYAESQSGLTITTLTHRR